MIVGINTQSALNLLYLVCLQDGNFAIETLWKGHAKIGCILSMSAFETLGEN